MRYFLYSVFLLGLLLCISGCAPDEPAQVAQAPKPAARKNPAEQRADSAAADTQAVQKGYSYTSAGKADPFRPLVTDATAVRAAASRPRDTAFLTPLQKYELKDLKLVAVVISDTEPTAMLEDPTGYGYVVRKGTLVGPHDGVVVRVMPNGLVIREQVYDSLGEVESRISTLTIQHVE